MTVNQLGALWQKHNCGTWGSSKQARLAMERGVVARGGGAAQEQSALVHDWPDVQLRTVRHAGARRPEPGGQAGPRTGPDQRSCRGAGCRRFFGRRGEPGVSRERFARGGAAGGPVDSSRLADAAGSRPGRANGRGGQVVRRSVRRGRRSLAHRVSGHEQRRGQRRDHGGLHLVCARAILASR